MLAGRWPTPLLDVPGFSNDMIWPDTLHIAFRGFAANFTASCLHDVFAASKFDQAFCMLKSWATSQNVQLSMDEIAIGDDGGFPSLNAKAWDVKLVCMFLAAWQDLTCDCCSFVPEHTSLQTSACRAAKADIASAYETSPRAASDAQYAAVVAMTLALQQF